MARIIEIDPVTRLEGHLAFKVEVEEGRVRDAYSSGEMFRGFETILRGREPLDAQQITQRICGVCPIAHGSASILAQDDAYGITLSDNGRLLRNLIQAANFIQSHLIHFYQLSALDFVDIAAVADYQGSDPVLLDLKAWVQKQLSAKLVYPVAPFLPRYSGDYVLDHDTNIMGVRHYLRSLEMRQIAHQMVSLFAGKVPHAPALVPGGVTERVTARKLAYFGAKLDKLRQFIDTAYLADVAAVAASHRHYFRIGKGCGNHLVYGALPMSADAKDTFFPSGVLMGGRLEALDTDKITEHLRHSLFDDASSKRHPAVGETAPRPDKAGAYSWLKAPRYAGQPMEVGPLSRILVAYARGDQRILSVVEPFLKRTGLLLEELDSAMGRHAARAIEPKLVADQCVEWLSQLRPGEPAFVDFQVPDQARGVGLTEAPRGALGHWLTIQGGKIASYQCVVPTTWNCSPRDDDGVMGPVEQAVVGTPIADPDNSIEVARVVRSFDPCLACAVH